MEIKQINKCHLIDITISVLTLLIFKRILSKRSFKSSKNSDIKNFCHIHIHFTSSFNQIHIFFIKILDSNIDQVRIFTVPVVQIWKNCIFDRLKWNTSRMTTNIVFEKRFPQATAVQKKIKITESREVHCYLMPSVLFVISAFLT